MPDHSVSQGETVASIAHANQLADYRAIWNHASNREISRKRDPNLLYPGDSLFVPEKRQKQIGGPTHRTHSFRKAAPENKLRLRMLDGNLEKIAEAEYTLRCGSETFNGTTDRHGMLEHTIEVDATSATLTFGGRDIDLQVGHLDPIEEVEGVQGRLQNLGYKIENIDGDKESDEYKNAVKAFQGDNKLGVDGIVGPITTAKLKDVYGC